MALPTTIEKDTLWKGIIEELFEDFMHYFFPEWAAQHIDFSRAPEFLDKELSELIADNNSNKRYADKLVKVHSKEGKEHRILIHIEVQGYKDEDFAERMFTYFYRIRDRYQQNILAFALFTDDKPDFAPNEYRYEYHTTRNIYQFDTFKLLNKSDAELNIPNNLFSVVMLTAKKALEKQHLQDAAQLRWKRDLVMELQTAKYSTQKIRQLLNFIRFYVRFEQNDSLLTFNNEVQQILKQRKSMGLEEAILEEVKQKG
ncbi:Rpn family recombination-promoting nuclease/putative transposase, partial [Eisenibacter elegans]|uniref:Rpn family recombination-promoting nuclease/putative transposase n=1 Tax=Eisenibacter elegans TaxID=997 RepID=UPI000554E67C